MAAEVEVVYFHRPDDSAELATPRIPFENLTTQFLTLLGI
jgi:hypothetical protein